MTENTSQLRRIFRQVVSSPFARWWLAELRALVPAWARPGADSLEGVHRIGLAALHGSTQFAQPESHAPAVLEVPATKGLRRTLEMPIATEENLRQVLEYQMDQYTPFAASQLYFSHAVLSRYPSTGKILVELVAVLRADVDGILKQVQEAGAQLVAVQLMDASGQPLAHNLLPARFQTATPIWRRSALPWVTALFGLLVVAALVLPLVIKREAAIQLLPQLEHAKKAAETVDGVRRELDVRIARHNYLLEKRAATPTVIQGLEDLTHVLPDDTWVQTMDWKGAEVVIQGETASSVKLVGLFEQSHVFKDASFRSPLTKGQTAGTERFTLSLQVRNVPDQDQPAAATASVGVKP